MKRLQCGDRVRVADTGNADNIEFVGRTGTVISTWEDGRYPIACTIDNQPESSTYYFRRSELRRIP